MDEFDALLSDALDAPIAGWDFSWIEARTSTDPPPWSYEELAAERAAGARAMLDMGTGGGEVLSSLTRRAPYTVATEAWEPNVAVARERLAPLGIEVVEVEGAPDNVEQPGDGDPAAGRLPFDDGAFDLVINRHEAFLASEVARVLEPGGTFITQQVDGRPYDDLRELFGLPHSDRPDSWLDLAIEQLGQAGMTVTDTKTGVERLRFDDVGAVAYYLRVVPWAIAGLDETQMPAALRRLHGQIATTGPVELRQPRFLLIATRNLRG